MRILTVYDNFSKGGLESQVMGQARVLSDEGVEMFLATGAPKKSVSAGVFKAILGNLSLDPSTTFAQLRATLEKLEDFIQQNGITVIHAHPFYTSIVGALAAQRAGVPFVVTLHGPVSITGMKSPVLELLFRASVLPTAVTVFCVSRETELLCQSIAPCKTRILPNAVEVPDETFDPVRSHSGSWMWAGRIDSFKLLGLRDLIEKMRGLDRELHVYGEGPAREELAQFLEENGGSFDFVELMDWHEMLPDIMNEYSVVTGMGRVMLEAAVRNRICLLVGYDGVKGILDRNGFEQAGLWNFSGRGLVTISRSDLKKELTKWKKFPGKYANADWVKKHRSEDAIWHRFLTSMQEMQPLDDPALLAILDAFSLQGESDKVVWECMEFSELLEGLLSNHLLADQKRSERCENALSILRIERDDLIADRLAITAQLENAGRGSAELTARLAERADNYTALAADLEMAKQGSGELNTRLTEESEKSAALATELETVKQESGELNNCLAEEVKALGKKNVSLQQQLEETLASLNHENETALQLRNESAGHLAKIEHLSSLNQQWQQRVGSLERSTSWRVTGPLRITRSGYQLLSTNRDRNKMRASFLFHKLREEGIGSTRRWIASRLDPHHEQPQAEQAPAYSAQKNADEPAQKKVESLPAATSYGRSNFVSIVLPIYNQADFLPEAIEGILRQTYENWELIVINDGSSDGFAEAISNYVDHPKIRIIEQPNQQLPSALNNGFQVARGEFYTWTSADNVMLERQIEVLVDALSKHPECGFAYSDYEVIDDRGNPLDDLEWRAHNRPDGSARLHLPKRPDLENLHDSGDNYLGASFLWRSDVHRVVGAHDENTFGGEDYDFWLRMHLVTPFIHVAEPLYRYRVHDNTLNAKAKELKLLENVQRLLGFDKERRAFLLNDMRQLHPASPGSHWRNTEQYKLSSDRVRKTAYSSLCDSNMRSRDRSHVLVVEVDVPLRLIDLKRLFQADILLVHDALIYQWLFNSDLPQTMRLLFISDNNPVAEEMLTHAVNLRLFEWEKEKSDYILAQKPSASPSELQMPEHIMLAIGKWRNGGMEQVMLDLGVDLKASGLQITLAVCDEAPGTELREVASNAELSVVGFEGDPERLASYVRENGVEAVSYHHCHLAADILSSLVIPTIYTFHNSYIWFDEEQRKKWRQALKPMSGYIAVSRQVAEYARKWFSLPSELIFVVPNGTSLASHQATILPSGDDLLKAMPETGMKFLNIATFNRVKCQDRLLRAFAPVAQKHKSAHLTLVGVRSDKVFYEEVAQLQIQLGLEDRCTIIPGTSRNNVLALMQSHDCFVLPSLVEGWSISLAEAVLSGMPVITSDVGSARDVEVISEAVIVIPGLVSQLEELTAEKLGFLYEKNKIFELALTSAMNNVLENAPSFRKKADEAKGAAVELFSPGRALQKIRDNLASTVVKTRINYDHIRNLSYGSK